jgi:hypothetical protein
MNHSGGSKVFETTFAYVEKQREATASDINSSGTGVALPQRKRKET